jgi:hypothetical protein
MWTWTQNEPATIAVAVPAGLAIAMAQHATRKRTNGIIVACGL